MSRDQLIERAPGEDVIVPVRMRPTCRPITVITGMSALRRACKPITQRGGSPLARAVRM